MCDTCKGLIADGYRLGWGDATSGRAGYGIRAGWVRSQTARPDTAGHVQCAHCGTTGIADTAAYCPTCGQALYLPGQPSYDPASVNQNAMNHKVQAQGTGGRGSGVAYWAPPGYEAFMEMGEGS